MSSFVTSVLHRPIVVTLIVAVRQEALLKVESSQFEGMMFWGRSEGRGDGGQDKVSLKE